MAQGNWQRRDNMCIASMLEVVSKSKFYHDDINPISLLRMASEKNAQFSAIKKGQMIYQFIDGSAIIFTEKTSEYLIRGH